MATNSQGERNKAAERHWSLSRRHFLRGLGAGIALPALPSLVPQLAQAAELPAAAGAAAAAWLACRGGWCSSRFPTACTRTTGGRRAKAKISSSAPTMEPLAAVKDQIQVIAGLDHINATAGQDGAGDHARASAIAAHRLPRQENRRLGYPCGPVGRPGRGAARRPSHAVPVARTDVRRRAQLGQLRQRLFVRVPIQHFLAVGDDADAAGAESAAGVRAACSATARREERGRSLARRQERERSILDFIRDDARALGPKAGRQRQPQAGRVPHEHPRDRSRGSPGSRNSATCPTRMWKRRKACRSSSKSACR